MNNVLDTEKLAHFLAEMNSEPKHHIGYCGSEEKEILHTLLHEFSDLDLSESFAVAYANDEIVGALGFDIDKESKSAEVWGPFIRDCPNFSMFANDLWEKLHELVPMEIKTYSFFVNKQNSNVWNFAVEKNAIEKGSHLILEALRHSFHNPKHKDIVKYKSSYKNTFFELHELAFPNTYYNAKEIVNRLDEDNLLLIMQDVDEKIKGYVYVEADPVHREGTIEYIAVSPSYRKQGIGKTLIRAALSHLFSYEEIKEVSLCVGSHNEKAIHLYQAAGFHKKHGLISFVTE
ncbi:N-acetyltransferase [Psychrobacillus glaciei]|uniref:N-acetyltransferase n=1 Tax=Psychrobacillus glaciei TaxID=2283160 RepID=A0A5J6SMB0_9BACI|nr:N-acetyltransferase [Psychrobacillus glaciei]QFF99046.1 N-acetyltransferase [Psychrobacillus glaciei]